MAVMTLVAFVVTSKVWLEVEVWVCVTEPLLVEKKVDVSVVPITMTDTVVVLIVEVVALTAVTVLVELDPTVDVLKTVIESVVVISVNVTWNETGKLGIAKLQT